MPQCAITKLVLLLFVIAVVGCRQQMSDQPRYDPLEESPFFGDGQSARPLVPGTVARGALKPDTHFYEGIAEGGPAKTFPFPITRAVLERGRERYDIYCSPCHNRTGDGDGMIVRRGFTRPPSFHETRLRELPPGAFFRTITDGLAAMPSYRVQIETSDRWAIAAYVRALQLSRSATLADVPPERRTALEREQR
jgi:hypothetical protein